MLIVLVSVQVVPGRMREFLDASSTNAAASRAEPGVVRFDVLQNAENPDHTVLIEVYRDAAAAAAHKETAHYAVWRDTVADMMATPRESQKFTPIDPIEESAWSAK